MQMAMNSGRAQPADERASDTLGTVKRMITWQTERAIIRQGVRPVMLKVPPFCAVYSAKPGQPASDQFYQRRRTPSAVSSLRKPVVESGYWSGSEIKIASTRCKQRSVHSIARSGCEVTPFIPPVRRKEYDTHTSIQTSCVIHVEKREHRQSAVWPITCTSATCS